MRDSRKLDTPRLSRIIAKGTNMDLDLAFEMTVVSGDAQICKEDPYDVLMRTRWLHQTARMLNVHEQAMKPLWRVKVAHTLLADSVSCGRTGQTRILTSNHPLPEGEGTSAM